MLFVPDSLFLSLMAESDIMRMFIFSLFSRRFNEIIELLDEVTFGRLDEKLKDYLIEKSSYESSIERTVDYCWITERRHSREIKAPRFDTFNKDLYLLNRPSQIIFAAVCE